MKRVRSFYSVFGFNDTGRKTEEEALELRVEPEVFGKVVCLYRRWGLAVLQAHCCGTGLWQGGLQVQSKVHEKEQHKHN